MPKEYPSGIWTRAEWKTKRDAAKVPKGAVLRVSVGDELDKFHAEMKKGLGPSAVSACKRLADKAKTYSASVKKKYPDWAKRVDEQIVDRIAMVMSDIEKTVPAKANYNEAVKHVHQLMGHVESELSEWLGTAREGEKLKNKVVDAMVASLQAIYVNGQRLAFVSDNVDEKLCTLAQGLWRAADGGAINRKWLDGVLALNGKLKPL